MIALSRTESAFLELLQAGICDKQPDLELLGGLTPEEWEEIIRFSVNQGVQAIVFDGTMKLPENLYPPRNLRLKWIVNVDTIEQRFDKYLNTCVNLAKLYADNGIKTMVLKGIGLSYLYPVPRHRECGDIDVWLFGEHKRGNEVVIKQGIEIDHGDDKHDMFYYQGIPIENHRAFTNEHAFKRDIKLEAALNEIILKDECVALVLPQNVSIFTPSPTFNAIFLARHMTAHFFKGVPMRQLCDWSLFLSKYYGQYDAKYINELFREAGLLELLTALTKICVEYLGMPKQHSPFSCKAMTALDNKIFIDILRGEKIESRDSSSIFKIIAYECRILFRPFWKNKMANGINKRTHVQLKIISLFRKLF